jgi:hypothetical protein
MSSFLCEWALGRAVAPVSFFSGTSSPGMESLPIGDIEDIQSPVFLTSAPSIEMCPKNKGWVEEGSFRPLGPAF